ncbi:Protein CBG04305 [Caenorhabditis briggsae]|uniref:Protein CBG04305 n=1 Tax=Caenorhabditis briggsae TaxID=6238 RepID=A8WX71_CAEBR|nr:Protein CBG04305 [Caenorhabditis briggsae]CAP25039.2 Protein CBG04305 [Caenorhabditis briggsae]
MEKIEQYQCPTVSCGNYDIHFSHVKEYVVSNLAVEMPPTCQAPLVSIPGDVADYGVKFAETSINPTDGRFRMYDSIEELTANIRKFKNFPEAHRYFEEQSFAFDPVTIYTNLEGEEYINKSDMYALLQNMTLHISPREDKFQPMSHIFIGRYLKKLHQKSNGFLEFVKVADIDFEQIEKEIQEAHSTATNKEIQGMVNMAKSASKKTLNAEMKRLNAEGWNNRDFKVEFEVWRITDTNIVADVFRQTFLDLKAMIGLKKIVEKRTHLFKFIRYPIARTKNKPVYVQGPNRRDFCVLIVDGFFDVMASTIMGPFIFHKAENWNKLGPFFTELDKVFKAECPPQSFIKVRYINDLRAETEAFLKTIDPGRPSFEGVRPMDYDFTRLGETLRIDKTIHPNLPNPDQLVQFLVGRKTDPMTPNELYDGFEQCFITRILVQEKNLRNFVHVQQGCRRYLMSKRVCEDCEAMIASLVTDITNREEEVFESGIREQVSEILERSVDQDRSMALWTAALEWRVVAMGGKVTIKEEGSQEEDDDKTNFEKEVERQGVLLTQIACLDYEEDSNPEES